MTVIIQPDESNPGEATRVAQALLAAASDPKEVQVKTDGQGMYFLVSDEVAEKIGLGDEPKAEPEEKPKKESKKRKDQK